MNIHPSKIGKLPIQKKIKALDSRKSQVRFKKDYTSLTLSEVLYKLFQSGETTVAIYPNKSTHIQCDSSYGNRRRSIEDAYLVAKYYIPGISYLQVHKAVQKLVGKVIRASWCYQVKRTVHVPHNLTTPFSSYQKILHERS